MGIDKAEIIAGYTEYQAFADVTAFVMHNGKGTYSVGNVPLSTGAIDNGGNNGGWCIVVVYENSLLNYNSVRVYDGFQKVFDAGNPVTTSVTLTGLDVPSGAINSEDAKMGVMCWEGDANLYGDFLKINGNYLWNATNQFYNPWNGTITENGVHVTTKNPDFTNQMGIDIDMFNVGSFGIQPNDTSVNLEFGTEADQYYPGVFTFSIRMKDPTITLEKTVADANKDRLVEVNEILTYTLKGKNAGSGNANGIVIIDTLPNTVTYLPNSLKVISSPGILAGTKTDVANDDVAEFISAGSYKVVVFRIGTGANSTTGGTLAENESYELQFQVTVNDPGAGNAVPSVMNIARVKSSSDANVIFVDDGTAIINPSEKPLPVTLEKFTASILDGKIKLDWTTSMEINCKEFQVEKSLDGKMFIPIGKVQGNGTTALFHSYFFTDEILPDARIFYYRLKQIDVDEKYKFSKIVSVKYKADTKEIKVSPNPFHNYINAVILWDKAETVIAKIAGVDGRVILSQKFDAATGKNFITITNLSGLPSGYYLLQFSSSSNSLVTKIFKE